MFVYYPYSFSGQHEKIQKLDIFAGVLTVDKKLSELWLLTKLPHILLLREGWRERRREGEGRRRERGRGKEEGGREGVSE